jgi:hypothetical protein
MKRETCHEQRITEEVGLHPRLFLSSSTKERNVMLQENVASLPPASLLRRDEHITNTE